MPTSTYDHPLYLARSIAKLLEADPIATAQVKEHISRERLIELLGIEPEVINHETVDDALAAFEEDEILRFVKRSFSKSELLELVA